MAVEPCEGAMAVEPCECATTADNYKLSDYFYALQDGCKKRYKQKLSLFMLVL